MGMRETKGGTEIAIADMGDSHLLNSHRMMCSRLYEYIEASKGRKFMTVISKHDRLDMLAYGALLKTRELGREIINRCLTPTGRMPSDPFLVRIDHEWVKAQYEAYCSDRAMPTGDMPLFDDSIDSESGPFDGGV